MPPNVTNGAGLTCSFGMAPSSLLVLNPTILVGGQPAATIMDNAPIVNIVPFGMCQSLANPTVAAATAAAMGVLTPMPCVPATSAPWVPGRPTALLGGKPALTADTKCFCNWGGVIQVTFPGQATTQTS
jgi:hypothetical protein